jgi:transposase
MGSELLELSGAVVKVDASGRRRYTPRFKRELVAKCFEPGVSVSKLSIEHGLNTNLVRKWMRKSQSTPARSALLPVKVAAPPEIRAERGAAIEIRVGHCTIEIGAQASVEQIAAINEGKVRSSEPAS